MKIQISLSATTKFDTLKAKLRELGFDASGTWDNTEPGIAWDLTVSFKGKRVRVEKDSDLPYMVVLDSKTGKKLKTSTSTNEIVAFVRKHLGQ